MLNGTLMLDILACNREGAGALAVLNSQYRIPNEGNSGCLSVFAVVNFLLTMTSFLSWLFNLFK